jgi:hypothetical protein
MNKPLPQSEIDKQAREAAAEEFALAAYYADLIVAHLKVGDDSGAIWTMELFKGAGRRAFVAFAPVRSAVLDRSRAVRDGGDE